MKFKFFIEYLSKSGFFPIIILLFLTILTRLILIIDSPFIYYFDSYEYLYNAIDFATSRTLKLSVGMPFVLLLGSLYYILSPFGVILVSRLLMLIISSLLICLIYLLGVKISGKRLGFLASILAIFEPLFLCYSIVPHTDVFVVTMVLAALYFSTSNIKCSNMLSLIFFYMAVFTKPEFYVVLIFPMLIFSYLKYLKIHSVIAITKFILLSSILILPFIWVSTTYRTRFDIIQKFVLFLTPELLKKTLDFSFNFYTQPFLNLTIFALIVLGSVFGFLNFIAKFVGIEKQEKIFSIKFNKDKIIKNVLLSDQVMISFCIFLFFIIHIIILTVYGYGYFIEDGRLEIILALPDRYLIFTRLLMSYPLAYVFSKIINIVYCILK